MGMFACMFDGQLQFLGVHVGQSYERQLRLCIGRLVKLNSALRARAESGGLGQDIYNYNMYMHIAIFLFVAVD